MVDKKPESKNKESVLTVQDQVSKAETLWALKTGIEDFSFRASDGSLELFQRMFPDSHIAQHMLMSGLHNWLWTWTIFSSEDN